MSFVAFLNTQFQNVRVSLHAGELALSLVPPFRLGKHVREAVSVAGARRIGHGVDIFYDKDPNELLAKMAAAEVAVEICLTSNDFILDVQGKRHPLPDYIAAGV
jgi:adenosine deaminase